MSVLEALEKLPRSLPSSGMYNTRHYESTLQQGFRYRVLLATQSRRNHRQRASGQRGKVGDDPSAARSSAIGYEAQPKCVNCTQSHPSNSKLCQKWKIEKQIQEIKINKNISYFEARRLIVPQLTQTYAQAARPSTISTATQTDPTLSNIICPPLQCLTPISSKNSLPGTSSSVSTFPTTSSSTQDNLLPSPSGILPTIQVESLLQIPIPTTTTTTSPGNNLNNLVSPLGTKSHSHTTPLHLIRFQLKTFLSLSLMIPIVNILQQLKPNRLSRNATPTEITTDDEDMITYDVEEEELEQDPFILPEGYLRALTPSRYRNYRE
ncbi:uncharacterized protein TNCV_2986271 [Trichonephila clavipes]|nr:uncharacterized protein TNCV_2986271 [Trichonephila clavipes]